MSSRQLLAAVLLASRTRLATAFRFVKNVDFAACHDIIVANDTILHPVLNETGVFYGAAEDRILTLLGCEKVCGDGYQLWDRKETISRLTLWVVPGLLLVTNFQFPPLPWYNTVAVIIHAIGDPIDSLWSILTRLEVQRRLARVADPVESLWGIFTREGRRRLSRGGIEGSVDSVWRILARVVKEWFGRGAKTIWVGLSSGAREVRSWLPGVMPYYVPRDIPEEDGRHIATVLAAYEEVGWRNASRFFEGQNQRLNEEERLCIMEASHELSSHRLDSMLGSWVAILTLLISLVTALVRTMLKDENENSRLDLETAHTIAVVTLLFIFIPLTKLSGDIGKFTAVSTAVDAIEKLNRKLLALPKPYERVLFPPLRLEKDPCWNPDGRELRDNVGKGRNTHVDASSTSGSASTTPGDASTARGVVATTNIKLWPSMASYYGMNSSWRPDKRIPVGSGRRLRKYTLLAYSLVFVVFGSAGPAIFLSATNRADKQKVAYGCRSVTWTVILVLWLISFGVDFLLRRLHPRAKKLWRRTILKDSCFVILVVFLIIVVQAGYYNSCWCRSNVISSGIDANINLNPFSDSEWLKARIKWSTIPLGAFTIILILIVLSSRGPLCKNQEQLQKDLESLEKRRLKAQKRRTL